MRNWRLIVAVSMMCSLLFCGCGVKSVPLSMPEQIGNPFSATVSIKDGNVEMEGNLQKQQTGTYRVEILSPDILKGMVMSFDQDQVTIEYLGLTGSYQPDAIPNSAVAKKLVSIMQSLTSSDNLKLSSEGGSLLTKGSLPEDGLSFEAAIDGSTGNLQSISIPKENFSVIFSDFAYE